MKMWRRRRSFSSVMTFTVVPLAVARALKDDGILLHSSMGSAELLSRQINANKINPAQYLTMSALVDKPNENGKED